LQLPDLLTEVMAALTTTVAASSLGRTLQLLKASGYVDQLRAEPSQRGHAGAAAPASGTQPTVRAKV